MMTDLNPTDIPDELIENVAEDWNADVEDVTAMLRGHSDNDVHTRAEKAARAVKRKCRDNRKMLSNSDDYREGMVDALQALLDETSTTKTAASITHAAYEARGIPKAVVDDAIEDARDQTVSTVTYDYDELKHDRSGKTAPCRDCGVRVYLAQLVSHGCYECDSGRQTVTVRVKQE